jgi:RNA polymerase primary sigma factor
MIKKKKNVNDFEYSSQVYFKEINKFKSLNKDEEYFLWERYRKYNDLTAKEKIINSNLKFVISIAKCYQGRGLSLSDLIAEGNYGLLRGIEKFDHKKGYKTISYSVWWIRQSILEALRERNGIEGEELPNEFEFNTSYNDEISKDELIDENFIEEDDYSKFKQQELKDITNNLIQNLSQKEKIIIINYFGLGEKPKTLEEIGSILNLTKERVRQIKEKALKKLRAEALTNCITNDIYK